VNVQKKFRCQYHSESRTETEKASDREFPNPGPTNKSDNDLHSNKLDVKFLDTCILIIE
jgi:hypothetical protein